MTDRLERAGQVESRKRDRELKWQEERAERREPARGQIGPAVLAILRQMRVATEPHRSRFGPIAG